MFSTYRINAYSKETGQLVYYKDFYCLADCAEFIEKEPMKEFQLELTKIEILKKMAFMSYNNNVIQTDDEGVCSVAGKV